MPGASASGKFAPRPISRQQMPAAAAVAATAASNGDRKSTRLNSSHSQISYAVFCLKKKKKIKKPLAYIPNKSSHHYTTNLVIHIRILTKIAFVLFLHVSKAR